MRKVVQYNKDRSEEKYAENPISDCRTLCSANNVRRIFIVIYYRVSGIGKHVKYIYIVIVTTTYACFIEQICSHYSSRYTITEKEFFEIHV